MAAQQIKPVEPRSSSFRQHLSLAVTVSVLLHVGAAAWWFSRPVQLPAPPGMQTVTVDLIALEQPAPESVAHVSPVQPAPPAQPEPEVLPDGEMPLQQKVVPKPPAKKPSPKKPLPEKSSPEKSLPGQAAAAEATANVASPVSAPVTAARYDAAYLKNPAPAYPSLSRRLGEEGRVLLRVQVSVDGSATAVQVKQSSGFERLDDAARSAVAKWKFVPSHQNGVAIVSWVEVPLQFSLKK